MSLGASPGSVALVDCRIQMPVDDHPDPASYLAGAVGLAGAVAMIFFSSSSRSLLHGDSGEPCKAASGLSVWVHH
jgi:hypothetical protein